MTDQLIQNHLLRPGEKGVDTVESHSVTMVTRYGLCFTPPPLTCLRPSPPSSPPWRQENVHLDTSVHLPAGARMDGMACCQHHELPW